MAYDYGSAYGSVASYFSQSGGTNSPGKSGGAGYNSDTSTGGTGGDKQSASAQSGSAWISAAASMNSDDKSSFGETFTQSFGGITNNQIIQSPGATNAASGPITGPPVAGNITPGALGGSTAMIILLTAVAGALAIKFLK